MEGNDNSHMMDDVLNGQRVKRAKLEHDPERYVSSTVFFLSINQRKLYT